ncbi:DUF397 domain-containing protein [Streptomyces sp. NPDC033538]|uniref:DUF397 domain-containing protein n=1 Tax=Streptomyces sp. NPDC033538 TaxID=3155367 RepID=UPI0033F66FB3
MKQLAWQKSSYCAQGDSCLHVSVSATGIHLTESSDPTGSILTATPAAFGSLLTAVKSNTRPAAIQVSFTREDDVDTPVRIHGTGTPGTVVTTDRQKWEAFALGVRAGEFDHFAEGPNDATTRQVAPQPHCPA